MDLYSVFGDCIVDLHVNIYAGMMFNGSMAVFQTAREEFESPYPLQDAMKKLLVSLLITFALTANAKPNKQTVQPSSVVYSIADGKILSSTNENAEVSIASMTKLITVLTVLNSGQSLSEVIKVKGPVPSPRIRSSMELTRYDLIELAMVSSDNLAARALIENYTGGYQSGIEAMNAFVQSLGATNTVLVEPTGLLGANKSTMLDLIKITRATARHPEVFSRFAGLKESEVRVEKVSKAKRVAQWVVGRSTNPFVHEYKPFEIQAFKTGFTSSAGWCITMLVQYNHQQYVIITAGNKTKQARKMQADTLIQKITNQQYQLDIVDSTPEL